MATDHDSPIAANEQAYRDLGVQERSYPDDGMSDRNVRIILRDLVRRIEALEAERDA